jgi:hypothetical protein
MQEHFFINWLSRAGEWRSDILIARIVRKIHVNGVPKMLQYREYFQNPSPDEGKWRRFYFEVVFRR